MWCLGPFCSEMLRVVFNNCRSDSVPMKILLLSTVDATLDQQTLACELVVVYFWVLSTRNQILKSVILVFICTQFACVYVVAYLYSLISICGCGDLSYTKARCGHLRSYISMYASQWKTEYLTVLNMFKLLVQNWSIFSLDSEKYVFLHTPYLKGEWVQDKPTDSSI